MLDPVKVDVPVFFPGCCAFCGSQTGPLVDTHVEDALNRRLYVCASCVGSHARTLGLMKGKEQASLLSARRHESELEKHLEQITAERNARQEELTTQRNVNAELVDTVEWQKERIKQLEHTIRGEAKASLTLVGGDDGEA